MTSRKIPVACLQIRAHDRADFERAWPRIASRIEEAAGLGARLIVLPEGTLPAYVLGHEPVRTDELERATDDIAALARRYEASIVYGGAVVDHERTLNAAIVVGPDGRLGHAAKQFLWHFDRRWFAPGETLEPIETPFGKLGVLVCADGRIPSIAATLVERGARVLVMPTAWVTSGRDPQAFENMQADLMANVRARENGVPFAIANKCGVELESVAYCGKSALIDADGTFVARGSERTEEIVFGELSIGEARVTPRANGYDPVTLAPERPRVTAPKRIAFTSARGADVARFAALAADADAELLLVDGPQDASLAGGIPCIDVSLAPAKIGGKAGIDLITVASAAMRSPRGLIADRLRGNDLFVWHADGERVWDVAFARTRAAELRAYIVVFEDDGRAYAVDPDGVVVAGTFDGFRMATFVYDRARAAATQVAPSTDVLAGLRETERIRALEPASATHA